MLTQTSKVDVPGLKNSGFTLIELMVALGISVIIFLAVGVMIADSSGWFSESYTRINSQPMIEGIVARKTFERVVRGSAESGGWISADGSAVEINYHSVPSGPVDMYAQFYVSGSDLILERGTLYPKTAVSSETICTNVTDCTFINAGSAVQMILILDDGQNRNGSLTSAILHN